MPLLVETKMLESNKYKEPTAKPRKIRLRGTYKGEPGKQYCCSGSQQRVTSPDSDGSTDYQLQPAFTHFT